MNSHMKRYIEWVQKGPNAGASVPVELGCTTLPVRDVFTNPEALQILLFKSFYLEQSSALRPLWRLRGEAESSYLLVFLVASLYPEAIGGPTLSHLISINSDVLRKGSGVTLRPSYQEIPWFLGALCLDQAIAYSTTACRIVNADRCQHPWLQLKPLRNRQANQPYRQRANKGQS